MRKVLWVCVEPEGRLHPRRSRNQFHVPPFLVTNEFGFAKCRRQRAEPMGVIARQRHLERGAL